jgi:Mrp family chromosome partitioning ATPase
VPADDVYPPFGDGGRAFNRLRNEVVAALGQGEQVVVITGASRGTAVTHVAANLAAALARTGTDVVLLGAYTPESMTQGSPLARLLDVASTPGLSDVLAGKANLGEATQRAARNPTLRVITAGGTASAAGLLQSQALKDIIATLRANTGYLVIEAPSTSAGADAQSLASLADAAIIAVELRRTRRPDIADASEQLRRVGTPVLGAIVMPRLKPPAENAQNAQNNGNAWRSTPEGPPETWIARQNAHEEGTGVPRHDQTVLMAKLDEAHGSA